MSNEGLEQHCKMSGKCKKLLLEKIRQQCELGILLDGREFEVRKRAGGRAWRANGIERALSVLSKQYPLASANSVERWQMQVEAAEDPWAEVQRIKHVLRLFENDGFCPLTKKLMNVKLPPEEVAKNRRQTAAILAISVAKDRRQKMAVLAQWKAEVEESRRERGSAAATYTDVPGLVQWNAT